MNTNISFRIILVTGLLLTGTGAFAHYPVFAFEGGHDDAANAIPLGDVTVSQVVYTMTQEVGQEVWMTFDASVGTEFYVQLGVPVIERFRDLRTVAVLVGPGLPAPTTSLPFTVPDGMGVQVFDSSGVAEPTSFHEPFTGTDSWIYLESTLSLPATGTYHLVAYPANDQTGKFWVAVGKTEKFGARDLLNYFDWVLKTRSFHEASVVVTAFRVSLPFLLVGVIAMLGWLVSLLF